MFDFTNYSLKSKYDDSDKIVIGTMMEQLVLLLKNLLD